MSKLICTFATKDGKACIRTILGELPLTATGEANGTPFNVVAGKKMTGSKRFCENHQIFEEWWPRCTVCRNSKVDPRASKSTARMCRTCIQEGAHIASKTFTDPVLDLPQVTSPISPSGPWAEVVSKYAKKVYKPTGSAQVAPVLESAAVTAAKTALEIARKAAQDAEAQVARTLAEEKERDDTIVKQRQIDTANRDEIVALARSVPSNALAAFTYLARCIAQADKDKLATMLAIFEL